MLAETASLRYLTRGRDRLACAVAAVAVAYSAAVGICLAVLPAFTAPSSELPEWIAVPVQLLAIGSALLLAWGRTSIPTQSRRAWVLVLAFSALSLLATVVWNEWRPRGLGPVLSYADVLYLIDYAVLTSAYGVLYVQSGGTFRSLRFWIDAGAVFIAVMATIWTVQRGGADGPHPVGVLFALPYTLAIAALMTMGALLSMRLRGWRREPVIGFLLIAGLADAAWEIGWLAGWLTDVDYVGPFYNFGDVLCFALIVCAATAAQLRPPDTSAREEASVSIDTFVPILTALLAIALVAGSLASTRATDTWTLVGLVLLCALLLVTRQRTVRRAMAALQRELATRAADTRLTEIVRQSEELFLIADAAGAVTFASPGAERMLRVPAVALVGTPVAKLFGATHEHSVAALLADLAANSEAPITIEIAHAPSDKLPFVLTVTGSNHLANELICGTTLTIRDVTGQRFLEREVLEAANQERARLAADVHDGLGQELTGISLLLSSAATAREPDAAEHRAALRTIAGLLNESIRGARDLARGLSPLYVAGGSLRDALEQLEFRRHEGGSGGPGVRVTVDPWFDERVIDATDTDHLYRIALEAVRNARRHGECRHVDVGLRVEEHDVVLEVTDDGRGIAANWRDSRGLGLRLVEYRARIIRARLSIEALPSGGTRLQVTVTNRSPSLVRTDR